MEKVVFLIDKKTQVSYASRDKTEIAIIMGCSRNTIWRRLKSGYYENGEWILVSASLARSNRGNKKGQGKIENFKTV